MDFKIHSSNPATAIYEKDNTFYDLPNPKGSFRYMDGEIVTYTCKNSVYRFRQDGAEKEDWKDRFDVECGWENKWKCGIFKTLAH